MPVLLDLSAELLQAIFQGVDPVDLASLAKTCHSLNHFINPNKLLWKAILLRNYDFPSNQKEGQQPEWSAILRQYVNAEKIMKSDDLDLKRSNFSTVATSTLAMIESANKKSILSRNIAVLNQLYGRQENVDIFLAASSLYLEGGSSSQWPRETEDERQLSAKLNVHYGVPQRRPISATEHDISSYAKARVYDLRQYTDNTRWGPFREDGSMRIDWEMVEAIMIDLAHNLERFTKKNCGHFDFSWYDNFHGVTANSYESAPLANHEAQHPMAVFRPPTPTDVAPLYHEPALALDHMDPYGITGTWRRVVCFLDYTDLHRFNFETEEPDRNTPRPPIDIMEAIRLITIKIRVTRVEPPGEEDGQDYPVVHFNGKSRALHTSWDPNATSRIRGTVRQTPEGEIRWTSYSLFHGEERWRSEAIQVGGIRSARGIIGTWFDKDFDETGPVGPTAFWKVSDDIVEEKARVTPLSNFWHAHLQASSSSESDSEEDSD